MNKKIHQGLQWKGVPLNVIVEKHGTPSFSFATEETKNEDGFEGAILMHPKFNWANIGATIGLFPSVGIAKKSGWDVPIEQGFSEAFFSKSDGTPLFVFIYK